ncbi:MAG TPA: arylsulfotransferase family protein [Verrucomicrobiae bacterium]|nr:arylsulfotransferase family protein [Verrucomicrobiae bacterium]
MKTYSLVGASRTIALCAIAIGLPAVSSNKAFAQLPTNFPALTVITNDAPDVANGYIFLTDSYKAASYGYYVMMLNNDGTPFWYKPLTNAAFDFNELPNGYLHYAQQYSALTWSGGGYVTHEILDENFNDVESIHAGNGYNAECHDFQMLPNGHALVTSYYMTRVDMSKVVSNGNPAALVAGGIIQELDAQRNVVFQWRSWDHYPFTSRWVNSTAAVISGFHLNCVFEDTDGNLVISTPNWVKKISRQTGQILWHLGGTENQFTFVGVSPQEGTNDFAGHDINRLPNGHVLIYNNSTFGPGATSKAHEYALDETNLIATHIWTYTPNPAVSGPSQGSAQRLPNGNTFVGWGGTVGVSPACTEVSGTNVVFQMGFTNAQTTSYRAFRSPFPSASQANSDTEIDLANSDSYTFGSTGVSLDVLGGGGGYNQVTVTNEPYAPVYPLFQGKAPRVLPVRVNLSEGSIDSLNANVNFAAANFGITAPTNITVYYRATTGQGVFLPQTTSYNPVTGSLSVTMNLTAANGDFGEFIFCYPDLPDLAIPPLLAQVQSYLGVQPHDVIAPPLAVTNVTYSVNQERPILLSWSPAGLAAYYEVQVSTNQDISNPILAVPYQTDAFLVWSNATPDTTYYYRVRTWNDAGASDWATGSFNTVSPFLAVTSPNGGEFWRRGLKYFVQWQGNIGENVIIDLYKAGVYVTTITNTPSTGAYQWQVGLSLVPGNDYTIRVTSSTNSALFATSQAPFSIDMPYIDSSSLKVLPGGQFSFNLVAPGAAQVSVFGSTNLVDWQLLQSLSVTNSTASFTDTTANGGNRFYRFHVP